MQYHLLNKIYKKLYSYIKTLYHHQRIQICNEKVLIKCTKCFYKTNKKLHNMQKYEMKMKDADKESKEIKGKKVAAKITGKMRACHAIICIHTDSSCLFKCGFFLMDVKSL